MFSNSGIGIKTIIRSSITTDLSSRGRSAEMWGASPACTNVEECSLAAIAVGSTPTDPGTGQANTVRTTAVVISTRTIPSWWYRIGCVSIPHIIGTTVCCCIIRACSSSRIGTPSRTHALKLARLAHNGLVFLGQGSPVIITTMAHYSCSLEELCR